MKQSASTPEDSAASPASMASSSLQKTNCVVILLAAAYILLFSTLAIARHDGLRTQMNDLGNMVQAIWGVSQGDLTMRVTNDPDGDIRSRLGVHANVIFYILAVPFILLPCLVDHMEYILLCLTACAAGVGGLGIYYFAKLHLSSESHIPVCMAIAYWVNPMVHDATLYDFHVTTLISAFLVWMLWAWSAGYNKTGWLFFTLALICKEDVAPILFMLGCTEFVWANRKRGICMALVSILYILLVFYIVVPMANFGQPIPKIAASVHRLGWLGSTPTECVTTIISNPLIILKHITSYDHIRLPLFLFLLGAIWGVFGGGRILAAAFVPVGIALLTKTDWMTRVTGTYYWIPTVSLTYMACILAFKSNGKIIPFKRAGTLYILGISATTCLLLSQSPVGLYSDISDFRINSDYKRTIHDIRKMIPAYAGVSAQNNIAAQLAKRRTVAIYPSQVENADFVIFHLRYPGGPNPVLFPSSSARHLFRSPPPQYREWIETYRNSSDWRLVLGRDGFVVFERTRVKPGILLSDEALDYEMNLYIDSLRAEGLGVVQRAVYDILGYEL